MSDLTDKQRVFIEEYLTCWNATEAARRAGYASPHPEGSRLLRNATVSEAIQARLTDKAMSADEVLARLTEQARGGIQELLDVDTETGKIKGFSFASDRPLHLLKKVSITDKGTSIELYDAQNALLNLAKIYGLFRDPSDDESEEEYTEEELRAYIARILPAKRSKGTRKRAGANEDS